MSKLAYTKEDLRRAYLDGCPVGWSDSGVTMRDKDFDSWFRRVHGNDGESADDDAYTGKQVYSDDEILTDLFRFRNCNSH